MAEIQSFRDLEAWQRAMDLTLLVHSASSKLPSDERFGLISQMRRAAMSVPTNIAEGQSFGKGGRYINHVRIALGSLGELSTELEIALRLKYFTSAEAEKVLEQVIRTRQLVFGLLRSLRRHRLAEVAKTTLIGVSAWWLSVAILG